MEFNLNRKNVLSCFLLTAVFNTVIALFLTHMDFGAGFRKTFILSQSIGLSICAAVLSGHRFIRNPSASGQLVTVLGGIALGATAGAFLGSLLAGIPFAAVIEGRPGLLQMLLAGLFFGIVVTYFFISRAKITQTEAALHAEQIKRLTLEKTALESRLRILRHQAQIEPHFLFNSLSNIMSLLDGDLARGKRMLANLTHYLRATLSRTREETGTLERGWTWSGPSSKFTRSGWTNVCATPSNSPAGCGICRCLPCWSSRWWKTPSNTALNPRSKAARSPSGSRKRSTL